MHWYRLYFIDSDGSIESVEEFRARDDVEAVRISRATPMVQPVELWCRARKIEMPAPAGSREESRP